MMSKNLYTLRKLHKYTQEQVAEKINVSRQVVAKWEAGETVPDIHNCSALARLYNVTIDNLVHYEEEEKGLPIPPKGKHFLGRIQLGENGEIFIPKKGREIFDLQPGDELILLGDEEQGIAMIKAEAMLGFMKEVGVNMKQKE